MFVSHRIRFSNIALAALIGVGFVLTGVSPAVAGYQDVVLSKGPIDYWRLNESGSTDAQDEVSGADNGPTGSYGSKISKAQAGPRPADGFPGFDSANDAPDFDDTDNTSSNEIDFGTYAPVTGSNARSVVAWVNLPSVSDNQTLLDYGTENDGKRFRWIVRKNGGPVRLDTNKSFADSDTAVPTGEWAMLGLVVTSGGNVNFYLDGASDGSGSPNINTGSNKRFGIGRFSGGIGQHTRGLIDEVAFFDKELDGTDMQELFNAAAIPEPGSLALLAPAGLLALRRRRRR